MLLFDDAAAHLHRRRELAAFDREVLLHELELLDLLVVGEGRVERGDVLGDLFLRRAFGGNDQRGGELAAVADHDCVEDAGRELQLAFDRGGRDILSDRRLEQVLLAVDDDEVSVLVEVTDVAGFEEAVLGERARGLDRKSVV